MTERRAQWSDFKRRYWEFPAIEFRTKFRGYSGENFEYPLAPRSTGTEDVLFQYISGTAWYGYRLEKEKRYRVLAVYRPQGAAAEGISSGEYFFQS